MFKNIALKTAQIALFALIFIGAGYFVTRAQIAPPSGGPPNGQPPTFLNISATNQSKLGWLAIGTTNQPATELDVAGTAAANSLIVDAIAAVGQQLIVGSSTANTTANLDVAGEMAVSSLAGAGERDVCADANGVLVICGAPPVCSDGLDNDGDGRIDAADPGCLDGNGVYDPNDTDEADPVVPQVSITTTVTSCPSYSSTPVAGRSGQKFQMTCQTIDDTDGNEVTEYQVQFFDPTESITGNFTFNPNNNWQTDPTLKTANNGSFIMQNSLLGPNESMFRVRGVLTDNSGNITATGPWSDTALFGYPGYAANPIITQHPSLGYRAGTVTFDEWFTFNSTGWGYDNFNDPQYTIRILADCEDPMNPVCLTQGSPQQGSTNEPQVIREVSVAGPGQAQSVSFLVPNTHGQAGPDWVPNIFVEITYESALHGSGLGATGDRVQATWQ